jgi:long-chain acyl-CoA synthetase
VGSGFTLIEGYGLTETSPVIAVNKLESFKIGSVGPVLSNIECRIADDGEIAVRGPQVTKGYYKKREETLASFDEEGWFYTGDIGRIDDDGFLFITDRKKNLLVTAGGKNVAPQPIEMRLTKSPYISHALLIGDKRKFISALIVPDRQMLAVFAETHDLAYQSLDEIAASAEMAGVIGEQVKNRTKNLAHFESIKKFFIITDELSVENGYLTPKLELKREKVVNRYAEEIENMYAG